MNKSGIGYVITYWVIGLGGGLLFRQGGVTESMRIWCFLGGNVLGITSTWFLMKAYAAIANVNVATVLCTAGAFVWFQLLLWGIFGTALSVTQWVSLAMVAAGMVLATWECGKTSVRPENPGIEGA